MPLFSAIVKDTCTENLDLLYERYPQGSTARDGCTPLGAACRWRAFVETVQRLVEKCLASVRTIADLNAVHIAVFKSYLSTLEPLVDAFPVTLLQGNNDGSLPLHLAVERYELSLDQIHFLLATCHEAAARANSLGQLPLHATFHGREVSDIAGRLVKVYSEAQSVYDTRDRFILHVKIILSYQYYVP